MGLMFVPLTLMVVSHVRHDEAGAASSLLNIGQQVGGSIGLAAIGTIAWTSVAHTVRDSMAAAAASGAAQGAAARPAAPRAPASIPPAILYHGLTVGFSTGLMIAGIVALSGFFVAIVTTWTPGACGCARPGTTASRRATRCSARASAGVAANAATR